MLYCATIDWANKRDFTLRSFDVISDVSYPIKQCNPDSFRSRNIVLAHNKRNECI